MSETIKIIAGHGEFRVIKGTNGMYKVQRNIGYIWRTYNEYKTERGALNLMNKLA